MQILGNIDKLIKFYNGRAKQQLRLEKITFISYVLLHSQGQLIIDLNLRSLTIGTDKIIVQIGIQCTYTNTD